MLWNVVRIQSSHCPSWDLERYWGPLCVVTCGTWVPKNRGWPYTGYHWMDVIHLWYDIWIHLIFCFVYMHVYFFSSSRLLMAEILHYLGCKQMYLNNGISDNYQPRLVISSEFWAINSIITMLLSISLPMGSMYGISTSYLLDFYGKCRQIYRRILWAIPLYHCIHTHPMSSGFHASQGPSRCAKKHWKGAFWDKENREKPMVKSVVGLHVIR